jgi:hypothetical protein
MLRKKLWELDARFHCPVIGTCLTLEELRRLARKAGIGVGAHMTDYELHHGFVQLAGNAVYAARLVHKWIDRKYEASVRRFKTCKSAVELGALWDQASEDGDIAGAFWALLTLPNVPEEFLQRVYGEVHMCSHLAGHTNRSAQRELATLRRRVTELEETLAWTAEASRLRIKDLERRTEALDAHRQETEALRRELAAAQARLAAFESDERVARLETDKATLATQLEHALGRAYQAEREAREWAAVAMEQARAERAPDNDDLLPDAAERCPPSCDAPEAGDCPGPDLCGRRVLYVGGRNRQVAHFRSLVERHNGEFLHHDGGLSENTARLSAMIRSADVVICPVDCVSHDACLRVKRMCKRTAKQFVALRSASLTSFSDGLRAVSRQNRTSAQAVLDG